MFLTRFRLWGLIKEEVRKRLLDQQDDMQPLDEEKFGDLVLDTCYDVAAKHWEKVITAN